VNKFSLGLKLAFVAAALALAAPSALAQAGSPARQAVPAAPAWGAEPWPAAPDRAASWLGPRALATTDGADDPVRLSAGPILGLICAIVASSVALGVAFGLRRRIDRIAGPDPDKEADD
jgi:hypothetical protein